MRYVVYNHVGPYRRALGRSPRQNFQATRVQDHGPGCKGGSDCCDDCRTRARDELTNLAIDVVYMKGGYGRPKIRETRHYVRAGVEVDPRGYPPYSEFVHTMLSANREHKKMLLDGWEPEKIEGYYKK